MAAIMSCLLKEMTSEDEICGGLITNSKFSLLGNEAEISHFLVLHFILQKLCVHAGLVKRQVCTCYIG